MHGGEAVSGPCKTSERSVPGKALKGHTFKEFAVRAIVDCQNTCERDPRCASYNFYIPGKVCELNSHTKEEKPNHFVTDELRFYMKREGMKCVKLCIPNTLLIDSLDSPYWFVQLAGLNLSATPRTEFHYPPPPPGLLWGVCSPCQSRGRGICKFCSALGPGICQPRGYSQAFGTHTVSSQNITTQRILLEMTNILAHLSRKGRN